MGAPDVFSDFTDDAVELQRKAQAGMALRFGAEANPDITAQHAALAKRYGLPLAVVQSAPDEFHARAKFDDAQAAVAESPTLQAWLAADANRAPVAHDEMPVLAGIGRQLTGSARALFAGLTTDFNAAAWAGLETGSRLIGADTMAGFFGAQRKGQEAMGKAIQGDYGNGGTVEAGVASGFRSFGAMVPGTIASVLTGNPQFMLGMGSIQAGGQAMAKANDAGASPWTALAYGLEDATAEYATEMIPVGRLLKDLKAGAPFWKLLGRQFATEVPTEMAATAWQNANEWLNLNPDKTMGDYLGELPEAEAQTIIATGVQTLLSAGMAHGVNRLGQRMQQKQDDAAKAQSDADALRQVGQLAAVGKLRTRDPEMFKSAVEALAENGDLQEVYVDARTLKGAFNQAGVPMAEVQQLMPEVGQQIAEGLQTNGLVKIGVADYATHIAGGKADAAILPHLKADPEGMTYQEAQDYHQAQVEVLQQEAEKLLAERADDQAFQAEQQAVFDQVLGQLNAAQRFTPDVNKAYATLARDYYVTTAAKLGIKPTELFQQYPLQVAVERMTGGQFDQAAREIDRVLVEATAKGHKRDKAQLGEVLPWLAQAAADNGLDIRGYRHSLDTSAVRHIRKEHGNAETEALRGQLPITDEDIRALPSLVAQPDRVIFGLKNRNGLDAVVFQKLLPDGNMLYLEEVRTGRKELAAVTLRKHPATMNAETVISTLDLNARSDGGDSFIVVEAPQGGNSAFEQGNRGAYNPATGTIALLKGADLSTFLHELGHHFLEMTAALASQPNAPAQMQADMAELLRWFGVDSLDTWHNLDFEEKRSYHEQFARGFEAYLFEGNAPSVELQTLFGRFRSWLVRVYQSLKNLNVELTDEVRGVMDRMLASEDAIKAAEAVRGMAPIFESAEAAGMTPEQFAAYQALGRDATENAVEEMQGRSLRDMRWLANAKSRALKALQKQAQAARRTISAEVAREVWSQPVYQAWQFLTAKESIVEPQREADQQAWEKARKAAELQARSEVETIEWLASEQGQKKYRKLANMQKARKTVLDSLADTIDAEVTRRMAAWGKENPRPIPTEPKPAKVVGDPNRVDETRDTLFVAIAKLGGINKAQLISEWGLDPKDAIKSEVFGKPVLRAEDKGLTIDYMAEALSQYGYLTLDEHGKWDNREFEEKFFNELGGSPEYSLNADYDFLHGQPGQQADLENLRLRNGGRLDADAVRAMVGKGSQLEALRMTKANGLAPDIVAELFGFTSGDEMVRAISNAENPKAVIEGMTDQRMLERHGELSDERSIERAAEAAIHNEARGRFVATEMAALENASDARVVVGTDRNGRKRTASLIERAARVAAENSIGRKKVRDLRPAQYTAAEARAARNAQKALAGNDIVAAANEKRAQLLNNQLARAAGKAQEDVRKGLDYLKKFDGDGARKSLDADYVDQIEALLERFDLRRGQSLKAIDKRKSLATWLAAQREAGIEPDIPPALENEALRKSFKDMTIEEFRGLLDTIKQIEHLGRLKHKLLTAADQRAYEVIRDEIAASIEANAQGRKAETRTPTTKAGRAIAGLKRFWAAHRKAAMLARTLDGEQDGGPMWEYFVRSANQRGDQEATQRAAATQQLTAILAPVFKLGKMGGAGQFFSSINRSLNREARLAIALNAGNEGNLQRLLDGEGWSLTQIKPVLETLTATEWQAVQQIWDHFESYRPQIAAKERRVYGKEPTWIDAAPFSVRTADGVDLTLRGGYYPIKYDPQASQRAEEHADAESAKRQLQGAYTSATTRRSFTKARAEEVKGRPLLYSLAGLYSGVNDVIHDLAWHEWLIDVNRLMRSNTIDTAIRNHYGPEVKAQFKDWIKDIAEGERGSTNAGEMALSRLRQGVSAAGLGFNVVSAMMQPLGFTQSIARLGVTWAGKGLAHYLAHPLDATRGANDKSTFMRERSRTRFRELNELRNKVEGKTAIMDAVQGNAYFLMMRFQQAVDVPTWWGGYEKAIAEGNAEDRAVALADQAVIDSQGGGMLKDLSAVERGGPALKLFTVFYSFMNTALNLGVNSAMSPASAGRKAADLILIGILPPMLAYALKQAITPGGDGDDEWDMEKLARKLLAAQLDYLMGSMVVLREFAEVAKQLTGANDFGRDYQGPAGLRLVADSVSLAKQAHQGEFDDGFRKATINVLGDLIGLPSAQVNRTITGAQALAEGETDNPAAIAFGYQKPH